MTYLDIPNKKFMLVQACHVHRNLVFRKYFLPSFISFFHFGLSFHLCFNFFHFSNFKLFPFIFSRTLLIPLILARLKDCDWPTNFFFHFLEDVEKSNFFYRPCDRPTDRPWSYHGRSSVVGCAKTAEIAMPCIRAVSFHSPTNPYFHPPTQDHSVPKMSPKVQKNFHKTSQKCPKTFLIPI